MLRALYFADYQHNSTRAVGAVKRRDFLTGDTVVSTLLTRRTSALPESRGAGSVTQRRC